MVKVSAVCAVIIVLVSFVKPLAIKRDRYFMEVQQVDTEEVWIPQSGSYSSAYFDKFDTQNGRRVLRGVEFHVDNYLQFYHGIEVLDDEPYRWNIFGSDPHYWCDCDFPVDCVGYPDGSWIKSSLRLLLGEEEHNMGAANKDLGLSVIGAPGPFDGENDQAGYSGNWRITHHYSQFDVQRTADPEILAEFTGTGYESTHMFYTYGGVNRMDCPDDGAENFNVDSSYDHYATSTVTCTYYWTYK